MDSRDCAVSSGGLPCCGPPAVRLYQTPLYSAFKFPPISLIAKCTQRRHWMESSCNPKPARHEAQSLSCKRQQQWGDQGAAVACCRALVPLLVKSSALQLVKSLSYGGRTDGMHVTESGRLSQS